jgi:integrase
MSGDGILFQRKSNNKCYFVYYTGEKDEYGKPDRKWVDLDTTDKGIAKDKIKIIRSTLVTTGCFYEPSKELFKDWLYFWLDEIKKPEITPKTYDDYEFIIRVHIVPELGAIQLRHLSSEQILKFYNQKRNEKRLSKKLDKDKKRTIYSDEPLSLRTLQKIQFIMNASLESARKMRKIPENPIDFLEKSTKANYKAPEAPFMESDEVIQFLESVSSDRWSVAFITDLGTGLRLGELVGLKWNKVDLERGIVEIKETRQVVEDHSGDGAKTKLITGKPKSEKSNRFLALPIDVVEVLKKWKKQQAEEKLKLGKDYKGDGAKHDLKQDQWFIFTWEDGRVIRPDYLSSHFKKLITQFGRPDMTFHKLRHSYASMLLDLGEEMKVIQENLGHAQVSTTSNIYTHILEKRKVRAVKRLDGFTQKKAN